TLHLSWSPSYSTPCPYPTLFRSPGAVRCPSSGRSVARAVRARRGGWGWSSSEVGRSEQVGARGDLEVQPVGVARVQAGVAEGVQLDDADPAVDEREVQGARAAALVPQSRPELGAAPDVGVHEVGAPADLAVAADPLDLRVEDRAAGVIQRR